MNVNSKKNDVFRWDKIKWNSETLNYKTKSEYFSTDKFRMRK